MSNKLFKARHKARVYVLQALYGWLLTSNDLYDIEEFFLQEKNSAKFDLEYFRHLLHNIPATLQQLNALISPCLQRPLSDVDPIELTILHIAAYELRYNIDIPYKVVINEALELTKSFGAVDSHKFVNGILDKLARTLRSSEL